MIEKQEKIPVPIYPSHLSREWKTHSSAGTGHSRTGTADVASSAPGAKVCAAMTYRFSHAAVALALACAARLCYAT